jgi:hypothetical protein
LYGFIKTFPASPAARDARAVARKFQSQRAANAAARAGNENDF